MYGSGPHCTSIARPQWTSGSQVARAEPSSNAAPPARATTIHNNHHGCHARSSYDGSFRRKMKRGRSARCRSSLGLDYFDILDPSSTQLTCVYKSFCSPRCSFGRSNSSASPLALPSTSTLRSEILSGCFGTSSFSTHNRPSSTRYILVVPYYLA